MHVANYSLVLVVVLCIALCQGASAQLFWNSQSLPVNGTWDNVYGITNDGSGNLYFTDGDGGIYDAIFSPTYGSYTMQQLIPPGPPLQLNYGITSDTVGDIFWAYYYKGDCTIPGGSCIPNNGGEVQGIHSATSTIPDAPQVAQPPATINPYSYAPQEVATSSDGTTVVVDPYASVYGLYVFNYGQGGSLGWTFQLIPSTYFPQPGIGNLRLNPFGIWYVSGSTITAMGEYVCAFSTDTCGYAQYNVPLSGITPTAFAVDAGSNLYVYDGTQHAIFVLGAQSNGTFFSYTQEEIASGVTCSYLGLDSSNGLYCVYTVGTGPTVTRFTNPRPRPPHL